MMRATELAHLILRRHIRPGDLTVDATVGNGHDALFLADLVGGAGHVYGFDVQAIALAAAAKRLEGVSHVSLFQRGHQDLATCLPREAVGRLVAVMFNLGYLPGAAKEITTRADTTVGALEQSIGLLRPGGIVTVVMYLGHDAGVEEAKAVMTFAAGLPAPFAASRFARLNASGLAPELLIIERQSN